MRCLRLQPALSFAFSLPLAAVAAAAPVSQGSAAPEAVAEYVAPGFFHRALVDDDGAFERLLALDAVLAVEDYGSFRLVQVDVRRTGGLRGLIELGARLADELALVELNGFVVDGTAGGRVVAGAWPAAELLAPRTPPSEGESRLRLVQFAGPVRDEWLDALRGTGAFVVTYVAHDAYVVKGGPEQDARVQGLVSQPYVLAVSPYEPAYKLRPELRDVVGTQAYPVVVQVIADDEGRAFVERIGARAIARLSEPNAVLSYWNVALVVDGANLHELARDPRVFAIEPLLEPVLLDERQGQIVAGNLDATGTQAASAAYLSWLAGKGFPGAANPFDFAVDVTDDGVDRGSTSDVNVEFRVGGVAGGASRLVYNHDYTSDATADGRGGHGNINASIIGGYNASTGTAYEDAAGYQYGLGIAPWVKLGNTKVFDNAGNGDFDQPANVRLSSAYATGARISSNSWGYTSGSGYDTDSQLHDRLVRDAQGGTSGNQELTIVFAAGNDGSGASTIHPPGTAKNIITAGAGENWRPTGTDGCGFGNASADNARDVASFSSRGPTGDARKKPEILAPGTHVQGAASRATGYDGTGVCNPYWPTGQTLYTWSSGTSHSTPAVAGACALVRQWFANHAWGVPSPAMQKAVLVSGAAYMTGTGANDTLWSNNQGMGRVDLGRAFDSVPRIRVDQAQLLAATGATWSASGSIASTSAPFRVVLAWTDAPGATTGNAFVNNLDLEVTVNGTLYRGNVFAGASSIAGGAADARNNLESVFLPSGTSGSFSIVVRATNVAGDGVPGNGDTTDQDFALMAYNATGGAAGSGGNAVRTLSTAPNLGIPDDDATGVTSMIHVPDVMTIASVSVSTVLTHPYRGDLVVTLIGPDNTSAILHDRSGGSADNLTTTFAIATAPNQALTAFTGRGTAGAWRLRVQDLASDDVGTLNSWRLTFNGESRLTPNLPIPDNNATGVTSTQDVTRTGTVSSIQVRVDVTHTYRGDLEIALIGPDNTTVLLHNRTGGSANDVQTEYPDLTPPNQSLAAFTGRAIQGAWRLRVRDLASTDVGTLVNWTLSIGAQ